VVAMTMGAMVLAAAAAAAVTVQAMTRMKISAA